MAQGERPDPDELLQRLREQGAERPARGRLRIYFGASAGVGKTYAMLAAAQREFAGGRRLRVGVLETHGRADTAAQLAGLPQLPLREVAHRGGTLREFDLDAALALARSEGVRLLLVDELAHANAPGSRHPKRWQDVQELLAAGIDVWSTLNVQHLESLNSVVGAITGVRVHETVPDTVLDEADEVVLVDVTPDELIARLAAGKVYLPAQAERAAQNFFRKGNLIALREIALRRTAQHVEGDVRSWRTLQSIAPVWNTEGAVLACVGPHEGAAHTVRAAARLAGSVNVRWHAAYVETPALRRMSAARRDAVLAVLKLAEDLGASTAVLAGGDAAPEIVAHAQRLNCAVLVLGRPATGWWARLRAGAGLAARLARLAPTLDIVQAAGAMPARRLARGPAPASTPEAGGIDWTPYVWAVAASVAITLAATPLRPWLDASNIVMLFLLGTVGVALRLGRGPAALAAVLNVAAFDYFFVAPRLSFGVSDVQYVVTFGVMLVVGLLVGQLTAGLRFAARISAGRERRAQSLFELARDLSGALAAEQVAQLGAAALARDFQGPALVLSIDEGGALVLPAETPEGFDTGVADWCLRNAQPAGLATGTLAAQSWHYRPLAAPMRVRGVLALRPRQPRWLLIPEQVQQLDTLARQIAIALERVHYVEVAQQAVVEVESERLRNALLAAISHDVRTPLTALIGLADELQRAPLAPAQAQGAQAIGRQARALNTLVGNLLDMARLQSGRVHLRLEWQSVEEVVGAAIRAARPALGELAIATDLPPDLPLVEFDAVLVERALVNLLENAAKYGAAPIVLSARATPDALELRVRDHGPGLPAAMAGREDELFDKFRRGDVESATPGVGLGLAICKAVADAHRGWVRAQNTGSGAEFTLSLSLPRRPPPC